MAYGSSSIEQYRRSAILSATPLQLVVMLYDGALRAMEAGKHAMAQGDYYRQNEQLTKAQKIIAELMSSLNMDRGGEVAQNLLSLYSFVYNRLVEANVEDSPELIDDAMQIMSQLRESWSVLESQQKAGSSSHAA